MTQFAGQQPVTPAPGSPDYAPPSAWVGWTAFAGVMMVMIGTFHVFQGLVALFKDEYFLVGNEGLLVTVDYTGWGWTHIIAGLIVALAGFAVFAGKMWARVVGVILAVVSALVNVVRGHSVVLRPCASRYQLEQPPLVHTVRARRRCRSAFHRCCAPGAGCTVAMPSVRIRRRASRM